MTHRAFSTIGLCCLSLCLFAGCIHHPPPRQIPIASGKAVGGTIWEKPVQRPGESGSNAGTPIVAGSRVDIYENFIIVTPAKGPSELSPHGWYTNLKFEKD